MSFSFLSRFLPNNINRFGNCLFQQTADISKVSRARMKRLPLTTKKAGKGYKKGYGATREGTLTSKGAFVKNKLWCQELVVPDLTGFNLRPYIAPGAKRNVRDIKVEIN